MAEVLLNHLGRDRFRAYSAGSHPGAQVNPLTLEVLQSTRLQVEGLCSKSWDEFARPGAPQLDFVITLCDSAAGEVCTVRSEEHTSELQSQMRNSDAVFCLKQK